MTSGVVDYANAGFITEQEGNAMTDQKPAQAGETPNEAENMRHLLDVQEGRSTFLSESDRVRLLSQKLHEANLQLNDVRNVLSAARSALAQAQAELAEAQEEAHQTRLSLNSADSLVMAERARAESAERNLAEITSPPPSLAGPAGASATGPAYITAEQLALIETRLADHDIPAAKMKTAAKVERLDQILAENFDRAMSWIGKQVDKLESAT